VDLIGVPVTDFTIILQMLGGMGMNESILKRRRKKPKNMGIFLYSEQRKLPSCS
jgi:hypothetical protein